MELIFNAEALRPPITGVGNYSFHLLRQFLASDEVEMLGVLRINRKFMELMRTKQAKQQFNKTVVDPAFTRSQRRPRW